MKITRRRYSMTIDIKIQATSLQERKKKIDYEFQVIRFD